MTDAESQLLYSSDDPHWDFDLPSTISDLPFVSDKAKHNILGGNAAPLQGRAAQRRPEAKPDQLHGRLGLIAFRH